MDLTVSDLLSRYPWYGGLSEEYLNAVLISAKSTYNTNLIRYSDIVLLHAANTIQIEQSGMLGDVYFSENAKTSTPIPYLKPLLDDLLEKEGIGLLWLE